MPPRLLKLAAWLGGAAGLALLLLTLLAVFAHTRTGERLIARAIERMAASPTFGLAIEEFRLGWPFLVTAEAIRIADGRGTWLRIERPLLDWHPTRLVRGTLDIERLTAERVVVERMPAEPEGDGPEGGAPRFEYRVRIGTLDVPVRLAPPVLGEALDLALIGTADFTGVGGAVEIRLRSAEGGLVRVTGTAGRDHLDLRWFLDLPDLGRWKNLAGIPLAGALEASGIVAGRLPRPALTAHVEASGGAAAGLGWNALEASLNALPAEQGWQMALNAAIDAPSLDGKPLPVPALDLQLAAEMAPEAGLVRIGRAALEGGGASLVLSGVLRNWGRDSDVRLRAGIPELSRFVRLAGLDLAGGMNVRAAVSGDLLAPRLLVDLETEGRGFATGIGWLDRLLGRSPEVEALARVDAALPVRLLSARIDGARADARFRGSLGTRVDLQAEVAVPDLAVLAEGLSGQGIAQGTIRGPIGDPAIRGKAEFDDASFAGAPPFDGTLGFDLADVAPLDGTVAAEIALLGQPVEGTARLRMLEDFVVQSLRLRSQGARVTGNLAFGETGPRGVLNAEVPTLAPWSDLAGIDLAGSLSARVRLPPGRRPFASVEADASNLELAGIALGEVTLRAQGEPEAFSFALDAERSDLSLSAEGAARLGENAKTLRLERLRLAREGDTLRLLETARIGWQDGRVGLGPSPFAYDGGLGRLEGTLSGRWEDGASSARLTGASFENFDIGTRVAGLEAEARYAQGTARLRARGSDGGRGTIEIAGSAQFGEGEPAYRAEAELARFRLVRRDDVRATASGGLRLAGEGTNARLAGSGVVPRAEIDIGRLQGGPQTLDVIEINDPDAPPRPPPEPAAARRGESPFTLALEIGLDIERATVYGRGLESEWEGRLRVEGTAADPILTGRLAAERGSFEILGKNFELVPESAIVFRGGAEIDPRLDVAAEARAREVTALVEISGTVSRPELSISSSPPLPQEEVLARVLFGKEAGGLSAFQQIQLGRMAAGRLLGGGGEGGLLSFDPIEELQGALGLDVLELAGADEEGEGPAVSAGKYIDEDTFLRLEQGTEGLGSVTVERELGRGFTLETELGEQSGSGVGLFWRKDY